METKKPSGDYFDYIDIDAIDNKRAIVTRPKHLKSENAPSRANRKLDEGNVLFSMVRPYLRNIAIVTANLHNCIASTGFYVCRPKSFLNTNYLYYFLLSSHVIASVMPYMKGENSPSIHVENLETVLLPLPPINEQIRIYIRIQKLFNYID